MWLVLILTIPHKFAQNFGDKIQGMIKLKACNAGWAAFVSSHEINIGDFLVFRYIGNSQFKVKIFGPSGCVILSMFVRKPLMARQLSAPSRQKSGCVKASSHNAAKIGHDVQNMQGDLIGISSSSDNNLLKQWLTTERQNQLEKDGTDKCNEKMKTENAFSSKDDQETPAASGYVLSRSQIPLTEVHRMKIFSRKYANKYPPHEDQMLTLQRQGKRWQVQFYISKRNTRMLSKGWKKFIRDNELQIGDTCLFNN
uniref:TF-B3 domain-containing protein n=1 Tax=Leersia perrieri TaxID=77586 RepID=A0A0D9VYE4_9ORYZ